MLSIILPAHNEEDYIEATIKSIEEQDFKDYELIVVLDGCTDKTIEKVKRSADKIIILKERKGPGIAKNEGAKAAKGEILVFLDSDTKITNNLLKDIYNKRDLYYVGTARIKPSSEKIKHKIMMILKNYLVSPFGVSNGIIFCSKENFNKFNRFPEINKGEDGSLVRKMMKSGNFYISKYPVISSTRRFDKKGYLAVGLYWLKQKLKEDNNPYEVLR